MRLTPEQCEAVRQEVAQAFGTEARVRLFGSRVDDTARGGDIDLHIEADGDPRSLLASELQLYARLQRRLGERRIDLVTQSRGTPPRTIDVQAHEHGVVL